MRERLIQLLSRYFDIGDSYVYNLTRTKEAFAVGTVDLDDFEEYTEDNVADLADHLLENGVIALPARVGQTVWIIAEDEVLEDVIYEVGNSVVQPDKKRWLFLVEDSGEDFYDSDIGKTVFTTREAAEEALKARENK